MNLSTIIFALKYEFTPLSNARINVHQNQFFRHFHHAEQGELEDKDQLFLAILLGCKKQIARQQQGYSGSQVVVTPSGSFSKTKTGRPQAAGDRRQPQLECMMPAPTQCCLLLFAARSIFDIPVIQPRIIELCQRTSVDRSCKGNMPPSRDHTMKRKESLHANSP